MCKTYKIALVLSLLFVVGGCKEKDAPPPPPQSFREIKPFPSNYFEVPAPPPPPAPPAVERLVDMGVPQIIIPEEEINEAPEIDEYEVLMNRKKMTTNERLVGRRVMGPAFIASPDYGYSQSSYVPPEPKYQLTDKDYSRENPPTVTSSYPVDRSYILTTDRVISGVLMHRINSQIPSEVRVMADRDIFGANNRFKLIEKGDIFIGRYESLSKVGDTRLNVSFYKIIRADGTLIYKEDEPIAYVVDKMGSTGLIGDIDNRNWERYGSAGISAAIGAIAGSATSSDDKDAFSNFSKKLGEDVGNITAKILEQQVNLAPVVTVNAGEVVNIELLKEIYLRRPKKL